MKKILAVLLAIITVLSCSLFSVAGDISFTGSGWESIENDPFVGLFACVRVRVKSFEYAKENLPYQTLYFSGEFLEVYKVSSGCDDPDLIEPATEKLVLGKTFSIGLHGAVKDSEEAGIILYQKTIPISTKEYEIPPVVGEEYVMYVTGLTSEGDSLYAQEVIPIKEDWYAAPEYRDLGYTAEYRKDRIQSVLDKYYYGENPPTADNSYALPVLCAVTLAILSSALLLKRVNRTQKKF